jgi:hypothetical protein
VKCVKLTMVLRTAQEYKSLTYQKIQRNRLRRWLSPCVILHTARADSGPQESLHDAIRAALRSVGSKWHVF